MSLLKRTRASQFAVAITAGLFIITGMSASAAAPSYSGAINFSAPTITRSCTGGTPTSVAITLPFNAGHLTAPISRLLYAKFIYSGATAGWIVGATPVAVTLRPKQVGVLSHRFVIPTTRPFNNVEIGLLDPQGRPETFEHANLTCTGAGIQAFQAPTVTSVNHPCSGATSARVTNGSSRSWSLTPTLANGRLRRSIGIAPHATKTVRIGLATQGADRFTLSASETSGTTSATVAVIVFSEACVRGR